MQHNFGFPKAAQSCIIDTVLRRRQALPEGTNEAETKPVPTTKENRMSVVSPEDIRIIPDRYAIGKRPLSILLGWGELTYTRLLDGNTPTPQHAAELRRLLDDPAAYARLLETGRERITDIAYARSFRAVDQLLAPEGGAFAATKIFAVADRLCALAEGDLTPSALQRLVYYAQGLCFARLGMALFNELPRAAATGPIYDRIFEGYSYEEIQRVSSAAAEASRLNEMEAGKSATVSVASFDRELLSADEIDIIDLAYEKYGSYSGQALSRLSRSEAPWKKARKRSGANSDEDCDERITAKSMTKFFSKS